MQRHFRINKKRNNQVINEPDGLSTWNHFTKTRMHWAQFSLFLFHFNSCSWEHGFCVSCPLLLPLLPLRRKQQNHLGVATSSPALPKEEQSHVRGTVTSHQTWADLALKMHFPPGAFLLEPPGTWTTPGKFWQYKGRDSNDVTKYPLLHSGYATVS